MTDVNVSVEGKTLVALLFDTERRPFVIKSLNSGAVSNEVPWRGSSPTRSAKRSELVGLLDSVPRQPRWEAVNGMLTVERTDKPRVLGNKRRWLLRLRLYVEPEGNDPVNVPFHRCASILTLKELGSTPYLFGFLLSPYDRDTATLKGSSTDLVVAGPGMVMLEAQAESAYDGEMPHVPVHLTLELPVSGGGYPTTVQVVFNYSDAHKRWEVGDLCDEQWGVQIL